MKRIALITGAAATGLVLVFGSGVATAASVPSLVLGSAMSHGDSRLVQQVRRGGHGHGHGFRGGVRFYGGGGYYPYYYDDYGPRCWWSRRYHRRVCRYY